MFKTKTDYDVQRIINEVASRHKLFLKPDDAAFALITMNRLIFDESLDTAVGIIRQHLEAWERACDRVRASTDEAIKSQVRLAGEEIRSSIAGDLSRAKFDSSYLVDKVHKSYAQKSRWTEIRIRALVASITCASTLLIVYITDHFTHHRKEQPTHVIEQHVNPTPQADPIPNLHNTGNHRGSPVLKGVPKGK